MRTLALAASALVVLAAGAAQAQGRFVHPADTNKDQKIDSKEWAAYKLPPAEFAKADANKDGGVNGPEFVAWNMKQPGGPGR